MDNHSQFSNCSGVHLKEINLVFSVTGAVCCFISAAIVLLIVIGKAYYSVLQRLFLYLMVAIVMRELFIAASIEHQFKYELQEKVCTGIAFIWNWTGILVFAFTVGMKVYLFFYVKHLTKGNTGPIFLQSRHGRVVLESLYVSLSILLTLCYASVPFFTKNYGLAGPWCWIRAINENCTLSKSGMINQLLNGYFFYVSGSVIGLVLLIAIAVVYCRLPITRSNETRILLKKTFFVIITFLVNIVIVVFALIVRVTAVMEKKYEYPAIWFSFGITFPISMLLFPIVYLICFFPVGKVLSCFCKCLTRDRDHSIQGPSIPESSRLSAQSSTYFEHEVPYTDNFTDITANEPLISQTGADTGYGSAPNNNIDYSLKYITK